LFLPMLALTWAFVFLHVQRLGKTRIFVRLLLRSLRMAVSLCRVSLARRRLYGYFVKLLPRKVLFWRMSCLLVSSLILAKICLSRVSQSGGLHDAVNIDSV